MYLTDPASRNANPHCIKKTKHPITTRKKASTLPFKMSSSDISNAKICPLQLYHTFNNIFAFQRWQCKFLFLYMMLFEEDYIQNSPA